MACKEVCKQGRDDAWKQRSTYWKPMYWENPQIHRPWTVEDSQTANRSTWIPGLSTLKYSVEYHLNLKHCTDHPSVTWLLCWLKLNWLVLPECHELTSCLITDCCCFQFFSTLALQLWCMCSGCWEKDIISCFLESLRIYASFFILKYSSSAVGAW